ncbi:hypothetical protein GCM10018793_28740 [Streptomyces sulfonofaciens]|uniref:Alpha/beta hydrolase n=1 Tax=Streptomyces sulfonofaciens TaxID=68272 RepID=A0A919KZI8_9ACTN|nr:hypothetical protein [Streptomyces sulfonofaciens]GHH78387.1 hypothetical protein GCM10018793_28740 [Streptomyces sulfonofaciens]
MVSIRANGINASSVWGDGNASSLAGLINEHLSLWQRLDSTGKGALAGKFVDPATGSPRGVAFAHHADMSDVGIMGHSRGGAGATWQAAESHRGQWPAGVGVKAVVALAPAYNLVTEDMAAHRITRTPLAVVRGTCDGQVTKEVVPFAAGAADRTESGFYQFEVHGADHGYFNTRWSPQSGQVGSRDDAFPVDGHPGYCTDRDDAPAAGQLTEQQQRHVGTTCIDAFFRRYLLGDTTVDPILTGRLHPDSDITTVDVEATLR